MAIDWKCEHCIRSDNEQDRLQLKRYAEMLKNLRENSLYWIDKLTSENEQLRNIIALLQQEE